MDVCMFLCYLLSSSSSPNGATAYQLLHSSINCQVANMVTKNDANLALRQHFAMFPLNRHENVK
ncbi:UNVERIFIED_CONTAM: hypothetical protein NCL1_48640 [Trichonephila clavipes]